MSVGRGRENWRKKLCDRNFISELQGRSWKRWTGNLLPFEADLQLLPIAEMAGGSSQGGDCSADLVAHTTRVIVLGKWCLTREGMLGDVSVQEEVFCCIFLFRGSWGSNHRSLVTCG